MMNYRNAFKLCSIAALGLLLGACASNPNSRQKATNLAIASKINVRLGIKYLQHDNVPMAKKKFLESIAEDPNNPSSWYGMAYYYEVTDQMKLANQYYKKAIKINPESGEAHNNYGTFLCRRGKFDAAIKQFDTAAKDPDYLDIGAAYENAGLCAMLIPNDKLAQHYFTKALYYGPKRPTSLLELARIYYKQHDIKKAKSYYQKFVKNGKQTKATKQFATMLYKGKKPTVAALPAPTNAKLKHTFKHT